MQWLSYHKTGSIGLMFLLIGILATSQAQTQPLTWHPFEEALSLADEADQPVLVDIWAPWCGWCHKMKQEVYPALSQTLSSDFILTRLNRDDHSSTVQYRNNIYTPLSLAQELRAGYVPTVVLLAPNGDYLLHISGFTDAETLSPVLSYIAKGAYLEESFTDFQNQTRDNG
ncbi:thioredoxin family protein [Halalkalibaculum sp. DA3122]